jgi:hypothetical protein
MKRLLQLVFGCQHDWSRPFTLPGSDGQARTYQVCLRCGAEVPFSLRQWKRVA